MQLLFNVYYKLYGIRMVQHLLAPRLFPLKDFTFPKNTTYHFVAHSDDASLINNEHIFKNVNKRIMVDVVSELTSITGHTKRNSIAPQVLFRDFFLKHRNFKYMKNFNVNLKDPNTLTVFDYEYLSKLYRYTQLPMTPYYQWLNTEKTLWDNIKKSCEVSERQNFLFLKLPDILPSIPTLRNFKDKINLALLRIFDSHEKRFILELWKWIDPETRSQSLFGGLDQEHLDKVNIVLTSNEKFCVLNLGQFNLWRDDKDDKQEDIVDKSKTKITSIKFNPVQLQRLLLKTFISIQSQTVVALNDTYTDLTEHDKNDLHDSGVDLDPDDNDENEEIYASRKSVEIPKQNKDFDTKPAEIVVDEPEEGNVKDIFSLDLFNFDQALDEDFKALEFIESKALMVKGINPKDINSDVVIQPKGITFNTTPEEHAKLVGIIYADKPIETAIGEIIDRYAEYGLMPANEYINLGKQVKKFMGAKSPYDESTTVSDFIKIDPQDLEITEADKKIPDIATVVDKSMLKSSLISFDSKYIKNILPKDIIGAVANIQKAGIIIQDYYVESENSALGEYEIHTLKIKPIDGVTSTLRFQLPKVDQEGNFISNCNKYHLRKQRGDKNLILWDFNT